MQRCRHCETSSSMERHILCWLAVQLTPFATKRLVCIMEESLRLAYTRPSIVLDVIRIAHQVEQCSPTIPTTHGQKATLQGHIYFDPMVPTAMVAVERRLPNKKRSD
ncbi:hypothetical protein FOIG_05207 [Fusarium odoratissimum NRRL 54006]|uniref:Uncharacterized protein n=2 Tax=Fusarium oxysporum species complex TaxID=171631 RepID=X0JV76_FUSO5|nr:uncharacterized protein FOIG_05207 [Fusarium odoratissimum NRRL 54006]EXM05204.1 hypothetical protein FOIG_05207 [Fusarium odoratissimum NRRL 54006]TXB99287.1 hypothetical protein FocTR4_00012921 [Fusarium oxysporum f. sp. cubense]